MSDGPCSWGSRPLRIGPFWYGSGLPIALRSSGRICGQLGEILDTGNNRGVQGTRLDAVWSNAGEVSPAVH